VGIACGRRYGGLVLLKLVRSGGLAGLDMVASLDSSDLSADQRNVVATLLSADLPRPRVSRPGGADQFSYQLEIHHGDRTVHHHWEEPDVPETVRPLLAELIGQAKPAH
jgi:hypothetical protein